MRQKVAAVYPKLLAICHFCDDLSAVLNKSLIRNILAIASPLALANLSIPLVGLADLAFLGRYASTQDVASSALGAQLIALVFWSFSFLRMSTTSFSAQLFGADKLHLLANHLKHALVFAAGLGLVVSVGTWSLAPLLSKLMTGDPTTSALVSQYVSIRALSAVPLFVNFVLYGLLIGFQRSVSGLILVVVVNLANCALDYWFIAHGNFALAGAAWASVIAELVGTLVGVVLVLSTLIHHQIPHIFSRERLSGALFRGLAHTNTALFLRTATLLLVFLFMNRQSAKIGLEVVATNAALLNLVAFSAYFLDSLAHATEAICGKSWGRRNATQFTQAFYYCSIIALVLSVGWALGVTINLNGLAHLYSVDPTVIALIKAYGLWIAAMPIISIFCYQLDGLAIAMGATSDMFASMLVSVFLIYFPLWYVLDYFALANVALWAAFAVLNCSRALTLAAPLYRKAKQHFGC